MPNAHDDVQDGIAEAFDTLSEEFMPDATATLVKAADNYDEYDTVLLLTSKRFFEFKESRKFIFLEIADDNADLTDAIANATHIKINEEIYEISTNDTIAPLSTDVTWKLIGEIVPTRGGNYR